MREERNRQRSSPQIEAFVRRITSILDQMEKRQKTGALGDATTITGVASAPSARHPDEGRISPKGVAALTQPHDDSERDASFLCMTRVVGGVAPWQCLEEEQ